MSAVGLTSRAIIGRFYSRLANGPIGWVNNIGMLFNSDQESETYKWLGMAPAMREWVGGRHAKGFRENGITITNKRYESTLEVPVDWMRRDKTGQLLVRINEQTKRANSHWAKLLSTLIINGESTVCYDGQYFFDTDHSEGDSGSQSNDITFDISDDAAAVPSDQRGIYTAPSSATMALAILKAIQAIIGFKDDQGEPMNEDAMEFVVMVPIPFLTAALGAVKSSTFGAGMSNLIKDQGEFKISVQGNARLTWTTKFAVFRTDGDVKPFILQEEEGVKVSARAEGSEEEFNNRRHLYGIDASRNVGYGYWQHACLVTLQA
jgi:phage major head subunit gpT-like protein